MVPENIISEMTAIFSRGRWVKLYRFKPVDILLEFTSGIIVRMILAMLVDWIFVHIITLVFNCDQAALRMVFSVRLSVWNY